MLTRLLCIYSLLWIRQRQVLLFFILKRQWNQCMRAIKRNAPCLLFDTRLAQCAVAGAASECTVFISWVQSPLLTQAWPHTPPPGDYQCPISDIPSFYQSPLCLSSPCPHIRQSSPVWLHLPVWPVAALSPRSVICVLKFLISPSLDGPLSSDDNKVRGATTVWWGCNGPDCRNAVSGWSYRAGLMAVNNKETLAITLALGPTLLRTKVQQVYTAFSCSQLLMSSLA